MSQQPDPREALAAIRAARAGMADLQRYPVAYDLVYGLICGLMVASQGLPLPWSFIALALSLSGLALSVQWWRSRYGWWVNGYSPKRAGRVAVALAILLGGLAVSSFVGRETGVAWISLLTGPAGFVIAIAGGRLWMRAYRRDLEAEL